VGRVDIREPNGRLTGYGTDSLVSPQLVLTNHHVLPDAESAASSTIEFIFQEGLAS
jgi:endonuclease G